MAETSGGSGAGRSWYWIPLAVFGVIAALPVPLAALWPVRTAWAGYEPLTSWVSWSRVSGGFFAVATAGPGGGPPGAPGGWYWAAGLTAGFPLTAAWYRLARRRGAAGGPGRGYLITGLALTAAVTIVPLLVIPRLPFPAGLWLDHQRVRGMLALLVIAIALGMLARSLRSRPLAIATLLFAAATMAADWPALRAAPAALTASGTDPLPDLSYVVLPSPPAQVATLMPPLALLLAALSFTLLPRLRRRPQALPSAAEKP